MIYFHPFNNPLATRIAEGFLFRIVEPWCVAMPEKEAIRDREKFCKEVAKLMCGRLKAYARHALN